MGTRVQNRHCSPSLSLSLSLSLYLSLSPPPPNRALISLYLCCSFQHTEAFFLSTNSQKYRTLLLPTRQDPRISTLPQKSTYGVLPASTHAVAPAPWGQTACILPYPPGAPALGTPSLLIRRDSGNSLLLRMFRSNYVLKGD